MISNHWKMIVAMLPILGSFAVSADLYQATNNVLDVPTPVYVFAGQTGVQQTRLKLTQNTNAYPLAGKSSAMTWIDASYGTIITSSGVNQSETGVVLFTTTIMQAGTYNLTATVTPAGQSPATAMRAVLTLTNAASSGVGTTSLTLTNIVTVTNPVPVNVGGSTTLVANAFAPVFSPTNSFFGTMNFTGTTTIASGAVQVAVSAPVVNATIQPTVTNNVTQQVFTNFIANLDTNGSYMLVVNRGVITTLPYVGFSGQFMNHQVWSSPSGTTNLFTTSGTNEQPWTFTGTNGSIVDFYLVGGGGVSPIIAAPSGGMYFHGKKACTNGETFSWTIPYGGSFGTNVFSPTAGWPGAGQFTGSATGLTTKSQGGGYGALKQGTNFLAICGGAGACYNGSLSAGGGGYPAPYMGGGTTYPASQTAGGITNTANSQNGSYLQGGGISVTNGNTVASTGGGGFYGGASVNGNGISGPGSGYVAPNVWIIFDVTCGFNPGSPMMAVFATAGQSMTGASGQNGIGACVTP